MKKLLIGLALLAGLGTTPAQAGFHLGALGGLTTSSNFANDSFAYGLEGAYWFGKVTMIGLGFNYHAFNPDNAVRRVGLIGEAMVMVGPITLGGRIGTLERGAQNDLLIGGKVAYDQMFGPMSIGAQIAINSVSATSAFTTTDFMGTLKFWFP